MRSRRAARETGGNFDRDSSPDLSPVRPLATRCHDVGVHAHVRE